MIKKLTFQIILISLILTSFSPLIESENDFQAKEQENDFSETNGIAWKPLVPIKKATFVEYDPDSYLDDYAYLASIPSSIFHQDGKLYASPLLFYEKEWNGTDKEKVLNSVQGVKYFMEDWINCSGRELDVIEYIKMPKDNNTKLCWSGKDNFEIRANDPYKIAKEIALQNWEYSNWAVIAVIDDKYPVIDKESKGYFNGTVPALPLEQEVLEGEKEPSPVNPNYHNFTIKDGYKYVTAYMEWGGQTGDLTARGRDLDLQLYDWKLGEVAASENWNVFSGAHEYTDSYVYDIGKWAAAVTYMPTKTSLDEKSAHKDSTPIRKRTLQNPFDKSEKYTIYVTKYPGTEIFLNESTPFGCKDAKFKITWEGDHNLGLIVRGPSGAVIGMDMNNDQKNERSLSFEQLGEGIYSVAVVDLNGENTKIDFKVRYSYKQKMDKIEGNALSSAANGAILASIKNIPLLYAKPKSLPSPTSKALDKLGVKKAYLLNLGRYANKKLKEDIDDLRSWLQPEIEIKEIDNYTEIYNMIQKETKQNDIVFSTIDPWTYWYVDEGIVGEQKHGLFIGPAAYGSAFHGSPLLITDVHPKLSCSKAWHNEFWKSAFLTRAPPSVGCMVLTGKKVYEFLNENNLDNEGMESILTVAGQFDIGTTWDRMLIGAGLSGRIQGSPVDASYWVARSGLYPYIIFANPALNENGIKMITGSSYSEGKEGEEVVAKYPIAQTWVSYEHRFNERGSKYWGCDYITADGITPYRTQSDNPIDDGVNAKYNKDGKYWPDLTVADVVPFYTEKLGCDSVFTTNFPTTMENLNRGAIMWLEIMHGGSRKGLGVVGFWKEDQIESNPWRGYEKGGGTEENEADEGGPDTMTMEENTGGDVTPATPYRHDGVVIAIAEQATQTTGYDGYAFDNNLKNIHSIGVSAGSCLIANTYLHLSLVRHGSIFQIVDPWLTSWYCAFAIETFIRDLALGDSVGQAYEKGIRHVGIQYLTNRWWWDIFENVVYYGDPDLKVYSPKYSWDKPTPLEYGLAINGHAPFGAKSHPHAIKSAFWKEIAVYSSVSGSIIAVGTVIWKRKFT